MRNFVLAILLCAPLLLLSTPALADDVTDQIDEALKAYEKKDLSTALAAMEAATALMRQARADYMVELLPEPLAGWTVNKKQSKKSSSSMFGGGISSEKRYDKDKMNVTIRMTSDSPMLQAFSMLFTNTGITGSQRRLVVIDGRKFMHDANENSYQVMVANKLLVEVQGSKKTDDKFVKEYLKAIDFEKVEKFAQ